MENIKIHLDTDLGGDIDDVCALAFLLRSPDVEITGITVVGDTGGRRTGYTKYVLMVEQRSNIQIEVTGGGQILARTNTPVTESS
jgi:purine nucleosidase